MQRFSCSPMDDEATVGAKARIPNPALEPLAFLLGEWRTTGTHPLMEGEALNGRTSFDWHEGGAFLILRSEVDAPGFPHGVGIIASDDHAGTFSMTWFDERGTSRLYEVTVGKGTITWRRDDPELAQTNTITAEGDGDTLVAKGRMSEKGGLWGDDLSQVFRRRPRS